MGRIKSLLSTGAVRQFICIQGRIFFLKLLPTYSEKLYLCKFGGKVFLPSIEFCNILEIKVIKNNKHPLNYK